MRLTRTTAWTAAGVLLLGIGLVSALSALLVPAGTDTLSALVICAAVTLAVLAVTTGPGTLIHGTAGVIGAFAVALAPLAGAALQVAGVRLPLLALAVQLVIVVGGVLLVVDLSRERPARAFTVGVGAVWAAALALVMGAPLWTGAPAAPAVTGTVLAGTGVLAVTSVLLAVVLLGAVRLIAVSEQSAYPAASEVTDR
ncbi:hypothetical protein [Microbacterium nymphoidis]|uniref:hypothetical protein n=1 Tax=Microbacterium nymphoidis TaxID=2898586 RepID=UPI001E2D17D8|nr:hypothetical protein [Microbacterium nymphoidis]MCD2499775.1 hypothetical protein [Microbacterium nymphoidis]